MLAGTVVGGLAWALSSSSCEGDLCGTGVDDVASATLGAAALAVGMFGGAAVGLIIGAAFPGERWHPVPLAERGSFPESGHGYTIGLSIGLGSGPR